MRVAQAHGGELIARPLVGALHVGRSGEALADRIHQAGGVVHDFGIAKAFVANAGDGFEIDFFLFLLGPEGGNEDRMMTREQTSREEAFMVELFMSERS